jgi:hypothetical protein
MPAVFPRIEVLPFHRPEELRDALLGNLDQFPQPLRILDPDFEVCGREEHTLLGIDGDQRLVAIIPFVAGKTVQVEEVVVVMRTLDNFLPWIVRVFPETGVDTAQPPRPIIVAEEISDETMALLGQIRADHVCFLYTPLRVGEARTLLLRPAGAANDELHPFRDGSETAWDYLGEEEKRVLFG